MENDNTVIKINLEALAGRIYTFDPGIEANKTHNLYYGSNLCCTGYSKYDMSALAKIACEKYIVENKLIRREGDARSVEIRFEFPDFYLIINRQCHIYPNNDVGKTLLILPKSRYINGFTRNNFYKTIVNFYHKYINEEYTHNDTYPIEILSSKVFEFKNQKLYPIVKFFCNGKNHSDYLYPKFYRIIRNNRFKLNQPEFKNDLKNMEFSLGFEIYADMKTITITINYNKNTILSVKTSECISVYEIQFNHYYYDGKDFSLGKYNFYSTAAFEKEILDQIYNYYCMNISFNCEYLLNRLKHRKTNKELIRNIIYMKPAVKMFIMAVMYGNRTEERQYPLLNSLVVRKILEEYY